MTRLRFHKLRCGLWAAQIPFATYVGFYRPEWERGLFTYLVFISLAALVESAATDWDQASKDARDSKESSP